MRFSFVRPPKHQETLPRDVSAPGTARRAVQRWFGSELDATELENVTLLTSELVTNAVTHGTGKVTLSGALDGDRVLVEVVDEGHGFERTLRKREFDDVGGRGLMIVDAEASRWGIHEGTTHVWFELERTGPRLGEAENPLAGEDDERR